jgi:manganese efflux pump family protein
VGFPDILLIAAGLAMDCFAVSVCYGFLAKKWQWKKVIRMALFFGGFQAAMPVIGWLIGLAFEDFIASVDHWIAMGLLGGIGLKMIIESIRKRDDSCCIQFEKITVLLSLALATSIDALIVGMGFAFLKVNILVAVVTIGLVSAAFTFAGVALGKRYGKWLGKKAEIIGGVVLIGIGIKILLEHLLAA